MSAILVSGVDRPVLGAALARHGLIVAGLIGAGLPAAALVGSGVAVPMRPALVQAADLDAAVALLARDVDDVVLASDPDALVAARLAALVRRGTGRMLVVGDLAIDPVERRATRAGVPLDVLPREYAVLLHLARAGGALVTRAELTREVLGLRFDPGTNVVAVHLSRLRTKLHRGGAPMLVTEKGRGHRLVAAAGDGG